MDDETKAVPAHRRAASLPRVGGAHEMAVDDPTASNEVGVAGADEGNSSGAGGALDGED